MALVTSLQDAGLSGQPASLGDLYRTRLNLKNIDQVTHTMSNNTPDTDARAGDMACRLQLLHQKVMTKCIVNLLVY